MDTRRVTEKNRNMINDFIINHWYSTTMIIRGKEIDMTSVDGFYSSEEDEIVGLITYLFDEKSNVMEITSLDSLREIRGLGPCC